MRNIPTMGGSCWFQGREVPCELGKLLSVVSVPKPIAERSAEICCDVVKRKLIRKRPLQLVAAASTYTACREGGAPVTLRELAAAIHESPEDVGRCYISIRNLLQLTPPSPNGAAYAVKVAARLGASEEATKLSLEVEKKAVGGGLGVRNPMTVAAAAVYLSCLKTGEDVRQSDVAEAAGVSVISIRECAKLMLPIFETSTSGVR